MTIIEQLLEAIRTKEKEKAIQIIEKLSDDQLVTRYDGSRIVFHMAIRRGFSDIFKIFLDRLSNTQLYIPDGFGNVALHLAIKICDEDIIRMILKRSNDGQRLIPNRCGEIALHLAAVNASESILDMLLEKEAFAQLDVKDNNHRNAMEWAINNSNFDAIKKFSNIRPEPYNGKVFAFNQKMALQNQKRIFHL